MQRGRMPMPNGFLPCCLTVEGFKRQGYFDEFLSGKGVHLLLDVVGSYSPRTGISCSKPSAEWRPIHKPSGKGLVPTMTIRKARSWCFDRWKQSLILSRSSLEGLGHGSGWVCQSPMKWNAESNIRLISRFCRRWFGKNHAQPRRSEEVGPVAFSTRTSPFSNCAKSCPPTSVARGRT